MGDPIVKPGIIFLEYLGAFATGVLLQNIINKSKPLNSIEWLHKSFPNGFSAFLEFERPVYTTEEVDQLRDEIKTEADPSANGGLPRSKRLIRIVLEPKESGATKGFHEMTAGSASEGGVAFYEVKAVSE